MFLSCFSRDELGLLSRIDGILIVVKYREILNEIMFPYANNKMAAEWIFQQDNNSKDTSQIVKEWMQAIRIRLLKWPFQYPDLNPIKHL